MGAQAFRPHVLDMFEPQQHPNDFAYPGAPPTAPYDNTGWTLAWQMGVEFDRLVEGFDGPFELIEDVIESPPAGTVAGAEDAAGYLTAHVNDGFAAVNRVLASGGSASWITEPVSAGGAQFDAGAFYLEADRASIEALAAEKGLDFIGVAAAPPAESMELKPIRVGLWDRYGGSMPSGWTRMIMEDFEFDFNVVFPPELDEGDLSAYDVLVFEDGAMPPVGGGMGGSLPRTGLARRYSGGVSRSVRAGDRPDHDPASARLRAGRWNRGGHRLVGHLSRCTPDSRSRTTLWTTTVGRWGERSTSRPARCST